MSHKSLPYKKLAIFSRSLVQNQPGFGTSSTIRKKKIHQRTFGSRGHRVTREFAVTNPALSRYGRLFGFAHRLISGLAGFFAFKAFGIQILPAAKEGTEQGDLIFRGGEIINAMIFAILGNGPGLGRMGFGLGRPVFQAIKFGLFMGKQFFKVRDFTLKFPG
jgi:hypothetical protein